MNEMKYYYRYGLIPKDSAKALQNACKKYKVYFDVAGWEDGMSDCYMYSDTKDGIINAIRDAHLYYDSYKLQLNEDR